MFVIEALKKLKKVYISSAKAKHEKSPKLGAFLVLIQKKSQSLGEDRDENRGYFSY